MKMIEEEGSAIEACMNMLILAVAFWGLIIWMVMMK